MKCSRCFEQRLHFIQMSLSKNKGHRLWRRQHRSTRQRQHTNWHFQSLAALLQIMTASFQWLQMTRSMGFIISHRQREEKRLGNMYKKLGSHYCANCWSLTVLRVSPPGTKDALISCFLFFLFIDLTTHTHHNNQLKIKNSFKKAKREFFSQKVTIWNRIAAGVVNKMFKHSKNTWSWWLRSVGNHTVGLCARLSQQSGR